jgi:Flp pilus assembly protein TadG
MRAPVQLVRRVTGERGAAALEMALVLTVLLAVIALVAPLGEIFQQRIRLERVAGSTARFATTVPDRARYGSVARRPTTAEVVAEAQRAWNATGSGPAMAITTTVSKSPATAKPGDQIDVTVGTTVNLGPFGSVLSFVGLADGTTVTVTAEAVGRQE